jgi:hypothetical protein
MALVVVCALGCSKKDDKTAVAGGDAGTKTALPIPQAPPAAPAPPTPKYADTTALWAMAPANATSGVVIGDAVLPRLLAAANGLSTDLAGKTWAKKLLDGVAQARKEAPFDFLDAKAWANVGADPQKGFAVFFGPDSSEPLIAVVPITNREAFRKALDLTVQKVGDREYDGKGDKGRCTEANGRYVCGETAEIVEAALKPHDAALATAVKGLPAEARGDFELYGDVSKSPVLQKGIAESPFAKTGTAGASLRLEPDGTTIRVWGKGDYAEIAKLYGGAAPPPELASMTAGAQTVMRWKFDPSTMTGQMPANIPAGEVDLRTDLVDQLTGDVELVTAGKGLVGGAFIAKIKDAARVKKAIAAMCAQMKQLPMMANQKADENGCSGDVDVTKEQPDLPVIRVGIALAGSVVVVTIGDVEAGTLKGSVMGDLVSAEAKEILGGAQTMALWSRSLDVNVAGLPKKLADMLTQNEEVTQIITASNWFGSQIAEAALGANLTPTTGQMVVRIVTFAGDPPEARAAYLAALDKRAAGDTAGYTAAMGEIETKYGSALVARRAKLERSGRAVLGPPTAMMAAGAAFYFIARGNATAPLPMPNLGGSFGDPGEKPPEKPSDTPAEKPADTPAEKPPAKPGNP